MALRFVTAELVLLLTACVGASCPPLEQVQKAEVVATYNVSKAQGRFYEVFVKDVVEAPCTCFLKDRRVTSKSLQDRDQLYCGFGEHRAWYNATEDNYFVTGQNARFDLVFQSPLIRKVHFPNIILGFAEDAKGEYVWLVEYQCMQALGVQTYMGFNIYHRRWDPPEADVLAIQKVLEKAGLGEYWGHSIKPMGGPHCNYTSSPSADEATETVLVV